MICRMPKKVGLSIAHYIPRFRDCPQAKIQRLGRSHRGDDIIRRKRAPSFERPSRDLHTQRWIAGRSIVTMRGHRRSPAHRLIVRFSSLIGNSSALGRVAPSLTNLASRPAFTTCITSSPTRTAVGGATFGSSLAPAAATTAATAHNTPTAAAPQ